MGGGARSLTASGSEVASGCPQGNPENALRSSNLPGSIVHAMFHLMESLLLAKADDGSVMPVGRIAMKSLRNDR
jgi:hypothetical protein